jgi:hypothetical protein
VREFGLNSIGSGYGPLIDSRVHGNESLDNMKGDEFLDYLSDLEFINKDSAPWSL